MSALQARVITAGVPAVEAGVLQLGMVEGEVTRVQPLQAGMGPQEALPVVPAVVELVGETPTGEAMEVPVEAAEAGGHR